MFSCRAATFSDGWADLYPYVLLSLSCLWIDRYRDEFNVCSDSQVVGQVAGTDKSQISAIQNDPTILHQSRNRANLTIEQAQELVVAFQQGYQLVWKICAGLLAVSTIGVLFLREVSLDEADVDEQREKSKLWLDARKAKNRSKAK